MRNQLLSAIGLCRDQPVFHFGYRDAVRMSSALVWLKFLFTTPTDPIYEAVSQKGSILPCA